MLWVCGQRSNCEDAVGQMWLLSAAQPSESSASDLWLCGPGLRRVCYLRVPAGPLEDVERRSWFARTQMLADRSRRSASSANCLRVAAPLPRGGNPLYKPILQVIATGMTNRETAMKPYNKKVKKCQFGHKTDSPRSTRTPPVASTATSATGLPSGPIAYACSAAEARSMRTVWPCRRRRSSSPSNSSRGMF